MGRSVFTLLVMLVTFAAIGALFIALDTASGVRLQLPTLSAAGQSRRTPSPTPTAIAPTASPTADRRTTPTTIASLSPTATTVTPAAEQATATPSGASAPAAAVTATGTAPPATASATAAADVPGTAGASSPSPSAAATTAVSPTVTATPIAATATATQVAATATVTATATTMPTPPGGITPPIYGTALNYTNNTVFSPAFMETLDKRIIVLTNAQRSAHGLAPLVESGTLDIIAASRSQDLVKRHYFDHYDPTGPLDAQGHHVAAIQELLARNNVAYTEVGENLIGNTGYSLDENTPQQAVQAWMGHAEHRANILHAGYTTIGVGMAAEDQSDGLRVVITQVFLR